MIGFTTMNREVPFEEKHGRTRYDEGTMFVPIYSKAMYDNIMNSNKTFHHEKGYW
jgi:hypothetical protein